MKPTEAGITALRLAIGEEKGHHDDQTIRMQCGSRNNRRRRTYMSGMLMGGGMQKLCLPLTSPTLVGGYVPFKDERIQILGAK